MSGKPCECCGGEKKLVFRQVRRFSPANSKIIDEELVDCPLCAP